MQSIPTGSEAHQAPYLREWGGGRFLLRGKAAGVKVVQSPPESVNFTNVFSYTAALAHIFVTCTGTNFPLSYGQHSPCTLGENPVFAV